MRYFLHWYMKISSIMLTLSVSPLKKMNISNTVDPNRNAINSFESYKKWLLITDNTNNFANTLLWAVGIFISTTRHRVSTTASEYIIFNRAPVSWHKNVCHRLGMRGAKKTHHLSSGNLSSLRRIIHVWS